MIKDASGTTIPIATSAITQIGAPTIRVFAAGALTIGGATVSGTNALAFVSKGAITITGPVVLRGQGAAAGPGSSTATACAGSNSQQYQSQCGAASIGAGGGGNATPGGRGGAATANGGAAVSQFVPLAGGCSGGSQYDVNGALVSRGGGAGGAIQLVSATSVVLRDLGLIDVGGGGGPSTTGGGAGGTVVIEAPSFSMFGPSAGVVANGGAGGGCGMAGSDATSSMYAATAPQCSDYFGGNGGTGASNPGNGCIIGVDNCSGSVCPIVYGGGGGAAGRLQITTKDGAYAMTGAPVVSVALSTGTLIAH